MRKRSPQPERASATALPVTIATRQLQPLRALEMMRDPPAGCIAFPVTNSMCEPHLHCGEFAVVDTNDREPQHGEVYVIQYSNGREIVHISRRRGNGDGIVRWFAGNLAATLLSPEQKDATIKGIVSDEIASPALGAFLSLCMSDGPYNSDHLREKLVGRVVGVLALLSRAEGTPS
jgi:hypothetical protein